MKKERAIPLILSVALALCLVGCGGEESQESNTQEIEKEYTETTSELPKTEEFEKGTKAYYIGSIAFEAPESWQWDASNENGMDYFYPPTSDTSDLLMIQKVNSSLSILDEETFEKFISGIESGSENYEFRDKSFGTNLSGKDYAFLCYRSTISGYNMHTYIFGYDCKDGYVIFSFSVNRASQYDYSDDIGAIADSVRDMTEEELISESEEKESSREEKKEPSATIGEINALEKALSYLDYTAFSRSGLIEQLEFEGFSTEEATYGVDNCGADWNEQAAKKAQSYLDYSSFSRQGLIDQLVFEGFTQEQAEYGVSAVGY